jgi:hypothetical protein
MLDRIEGIAELGKAHGQRKTPALAQCDEQGITATM